MAETTNPTPENKTTAKADGKSRYKVRSRLDFNGQVYEAGDSVSLTEAEAAPLVGGAVEAK